MSDPAGDWGELARLAAELGVETAYWDVRGQRHLAQPEALLAVARAAGAPVTSRADVPAALAGLARERVERGLEPVLVAWEGEAAPVVLWVLAEGPPLVRAELVDEDGQARRWDLDLTGLTDGIGEAGGGDGAERVVDGRRWRAVSFDLPGPLSIGRHQLRVEHGDRSATATVLSAPRLVVTPRPGERAWGVLAPLHALSHVDGAGPSVTDLERVGAWLGGHGGQVIASLPILSTYLGHGAEPFDPSPYAPVSRRFWNELYLDLGRLPGTGGPGGPGGAGRLDVAGGVPLPGRPFDHRARAAHVRQAVGAVVAELGDGLEELPGYRQYAATTPELDDYSAFRATVERWGPHLMAWPDRARAGTLAPGDHDPDAARYHRYVQWALHDQLGAVAAALRGRGQRLYLDMPVGSNADGFDTWRHPQLFGWGASTGAPPDDFFEHGQDWGFPPLVPAASRQDGHRFLGACLRAQVEVAGMLRLDHVMQLERLFWVPEGMPAQAGVYVRYPREELFAVLSIESHRAGAIVVGEDLGTVPAEIRTAMSDHGLLGMYVLQFEAPGGPGGLRPPPARSVASLNTHDTPTFAAWLDAADVGVSESLDLVDAARAAEIRDARAAQRHHLREALVERGDLAPDGDDAAFVRAALAYLAASDADTVLVTADDLWGETEPQNVPGTGVDRPNWVHRWPRPLEDVVADPGLGADLDALARARQASASRGTTGGDR